MARRGWRYLATRLNGDGTETVLDMDLPVEDVSIDDVLSGDQALNAKIEPAYSRLIGPDNRPILQEWSTAIYAENDGDIRFGGILVNSSIDGPGLDLETVGFTGYMRDMPYTGSGYKGVKVDGIDPLRVAWAHVQGQRGGNLGLVVDSTTTGGKVLLGSTLAADEYDPAGGGLDGLTLESQAYKFNIYTNHDLGGDIDDLATAVPFDYHERHYWKADGTIGHALDIGYPAIGRKRDDLRFVFGVNVFEPPTIDRDGSIYASGTLVLGAGDGAQAKRSLIEPPTRPDRLRRIAVVVDDTLKSVKACTRRADAENQWRKTLDDITSVVAIDHANARLGAVEVGDTIRIEGQGDWQTWDVEVRVLAISYEPANGGVAEYSVARTDKMTS